MHVSIVIVSFRNIADVERCISGIAASEYKDYEVWICENGGRAAFEALWNALKTADFKAVRFTVFDAGGNLGYAGGVNECIKRSPDADAWWILNPDTVPAPQTLFSLVNELSLGKADAVGCTLFFANGRVQSHGGHWSPLLARSRSIGMGGEAGQAVEKSEIEAHQNYLNGASMLVGKTFLAQVGYMRTDYFLYCEEVEWCLRAKKRGVSLGYACGEGLLHYQGTTTGAGGVANDRSRLSIYLSERNKLLVTRDLYPYALPVAVFSTFVQLSIRYMRAAAFRQFLFALHGWFQGIRGERGCPSWLRL